MLVIASKVFADEIALAVGHNDEQLGAMRQQLAHESEIVFDMLDHVRADDDVDITKRAHVAADEFGEAPETLAGQIDSSGGKVDAGQGGAWKGRLVDGKASPAPHPKSQSDPENSSSRW